MCLDAVSFVHKRNPCADALAPAARVWRTPDEGLELTGQASQFRHLKSLLESQAAASISGIQITNANYNEAIEILKERFAQKQAIINSHVDVLMNLPQISYERDVRGLRNFMIT